jgi:isoquinoline 1-oxidoreductase alpha subunit
MIAIKVNGKTYNLDVDPGMPILWVLRDKLGLTGTKFGCGAAQCGACTVHLNGDGIRSCISPVSRAIGKEIVTIEGLDAKLRKPLEQAWIQEDVPQCGYCQCGQMMAAAILIRDKANPTDEDINDAMTGNICRCGTYQRIRKAIHVAANLKKQTIK